MRRHSPILLIKFGALVAIAIALSAVHHGYAAGESQLLAGVVRSAAGQPLEGVTISAWLVGKPVTTSVFTDARGGYYFPPLPPGSYRIRAQAPGFEKADASVEVGASAHHQDFTITPTNDYFLQLSGDQQLAAWPEDTPARRKMKYVFRRECTSCHEANVALQNRFDAKGWEAIITAMARIAAAGGFADRQRPDNATITHFKKELAAYLAEVRGPSPSPVQPPVPPRPTGDATLAVVYEYDIPIESADAYLPNTGSDWSLGPVAGSGGGIGLHDAHVDRDGNVWLTDNTEHSQTRTIARVDGKTGEVKKFKYPGREGAGHAHGIVVARDGTVWFTLSTGNAFTTGGVEEGADGTPGGIFGHLDPHTGTIEAFTPPKGMAEATISIEEDGQGKIWASTPKGAVRFDPKTKQFTEFVSKTQPGPSYGMAGDRHGNGWWTQIGIDTIGFSDIAAGTSREIKLPPGTYNVVKDGDFSPEDLKAYGPRGYGIQTPRRLAADPASDDIWVPNYAGQTLLRINSQTLKTTFYKAPRWGINPYMAGVDSGGNVWMNLQNSDDLAKFDPKTEKWTFYSWPTRGTSPRGLHLMDRDGTLQLSITYWNASRVARMLIRTPDQVDALRKQAVAAR
jgi:streptogramin lyase